MAQLSLLEIILHAETVALKQGMVYNMSETSFICLFQLS